MNIVKKVVNILNKKYNIKKVDSAIVVGSGLMSSAPDLEDKFTVSYESLGLPKSKVKGHSGSFTFGKYNNKIVALVSRMHYYESGSIEKVRIPLEIMAGLNCETAILLTSCGGLNETYNVGDVMLIEDQINMSGVNPLIGMEEIKFVSMTDCYNSVLKNEVKSICNKLKIDIKNGVFCQMSGPSYETNAEVKMLRMLGADAVSMSTAHDCIIANYLNMRVVGFSVIVNVFKNTNDELTHEEVLENASKACEKVKNIINVLI